LAQVERAILCPPLLSTSAFWFTSNPRLEAIYENFGQNLKDIIAAGRNSGAKIVLSTVAVNLRDCAPFASLHRPDLSESQLSEWQRFFDAGVKAQASGRWRRQVRAVFPAPIFL
jgi:hypothetical protein